MWGPSCPLSLDCTGSSVSLIEFSKAQALIYLVQMIVILYPPFTVFSVLHAHFVQKRAEALSKRLFTERRGLSHEEK